jgi:hypothetical protein
MGGPIFCAGDFSFFFPFGMGVPFGDMSDSFEDFSRGRLFLFGPVFGTGSLLVQLFVSRQFVGMSGLPATGRIISRTCPSLNWVLGLPPIRTYF